jgi:hypothetical protein
MVKHLDNLSEDDITSVVIPSAIPLVYTFAQDGDDSSVYPIGRPSKQGMRGRFVVTKELLELNLAASQNLEMSENIDDDDGEFKLQLTNSLEKVVSQGGVRPRSSLLDADVASPSSGSDTKSGGSSQIMEAGWMTVRVRNKKG